MKKVLIILLILGVLFLGAIVGIIALGVSQIDNIVKAAIERGGTYATQVDTTVTSVDVGLTAGTFAMDELKIANPPGFDTDHFLVLKDTDVSFDLNSLRSDTIVIPTVTVDGIDVILDKGGNPSNYNTILNSLKRFESSDQPKAAPENRGGKKVAIDSLVLENIDVRVANYPGLSLVAGDVAINIPKVELKDIGRDKPMTPAEIANLVIKTVLTAAVEAGGGILPADMLGELGNGLQGLTSLGEMGITAIGDAGQVFGESMDEVLQNAGKAVEDLGKEATKAVDEAGKKVENEINKAADEVKKGINNILGGKKKNEEEDDGGP
jgi:hypothetical protein